jgi:hypothetical protein
MANADDLVDGFIKLRNKKRQIEERHKAELKPIREMQERLEIAMLMLLNGDGAESIRTQHGTVYKITRTRTKVENWDEILDYIMQNNLEHMLEKRVSKSAIEEFLEANGSLPPGVSLEKDITVGVRKA